MSILIKGMEMPTEGTVIAVYKLNGQFYASVHGTELCPIMPVPPHGRLIDADKLKADNPIHMGADVPYVTEVTVEEIIDAAPTIIPAEEDK